MGKSFVCYWIGRDENAEEKGEATMRTFLASFICSIAGGIIGILVLWGIFIYAFQGLIDGMAAVLAMMVLPIGVSAFMVWALFKGVAKMMKLGESNGDCGAVLEECAVMGADFGRDSEKGKWDLESRIGLGRLGR